MKKSVSIILSLILTTVIAVCAIGCGNAGAPSETASYRVSVDGGSGAGSYYAGTICTVTAEVPEGKQFLKWIKNGQEASVNAVYSFNVKENTRLIAVFGDGSEYANKQVCTVKTQNGLGGGGYVKGGKCTVNTFAEDAPRKFIGWFKVVDGEVTGDALSTERKYTFDVTDDVTLSAEYANKIVRLRTPANANDEMIKIVPGQGVITFDRQYNAETGERITAFTEGVAYVLIWIYTSNADDAEPIGSVKMVTYYDENDAPHGYICSMNYDEATGVGRRINFLGTPGDYHTPDGNTHWFFKNNIKDMVGEYSETVTYYFAAQAIGIVDPDGDIYIDSPISAKGNGVLNM